MTNKYINFTNLFSKSPWDDSDEDNIFTKKRNKGGGNFNLNNFQLDIFNPKILGVLLLLILGVWLSSGIYKIKEGDRAIVLTFGKYNREAMPGLHYHFPNPIEKVIIEKVDKSRRIEIGYRSTGKSGLSGSSLSREVKSESIMLTGDENIIELNVDTTWHIENLKNYVFNISNPQETVKAAAESAIREVIGNTPIAEVLSNKKQFIAEKVEELIQKTLDTYDSGVKIEQVKLLRAEPPEKVIDAYRDVQTAKADKEKIINEAESYRNDILPKARGEAAQLLQQAEGYKQETISKSRGDIARFNFIYDQYLVNRRVVTDRLYLEAIEYVLKNSDKVIMGNESMLPHMSIKQKN